MLETIREYAMEKLEGSGEADIARRKLLEWCVELAQRAEPELTGPDQVLWYDRIDVEHSNIRVSLSWGIDRLEAQEPMIRLTGSLWRYWLERGHVGEGRLWLGRTLAGSTEISPGDRAKALRAAGTLAMWQSDLPAARGYHEESVGISRSMGNDLGAAASLSHLGIVAWRTGDTAAAKRLLQESLAIRRSHGDRAGESTSLGNLGLVVQAEGDFEAARSLLEQSLEIDRELGDRLGVAGSLSYLGELAREAGDLARADALHRDGLTRQAELRQREVLPMALEGMAGLAGGRARYARAARLFGAAEVLRRVIGLPVPPSAEPGYRRDLDVVRAALGEDELERLRSEGREMTLDAAISYALSAEGD
jgi:non-specific serine/threonine protein kinase